MFLKSVTRILFTGNRKQVAYVENKTLKTFSQYKNNIIARFSTFAGHFTPHRGPDLARGQSFEYLCPISSVASTVNI